jgi:hypothetical protein
MGSSPLAMEEVRLSVNQDVLVKASEGCPSHGRGDQRVRSWGCVRKKRRTGRLVWERDATWGRRGTCPIGGLLSTEALRRDERQERARGRECRPGRSACQGRGHKTCAILSRIGNNSRRALPWARHVPLCQLGSHWIFSILLCRLPITRIPATRLPRAHRLWPYRP